MQYNLHSDGRLDLPESPDFALSPQLDFYLGQAATIFNKYKLNGTADLSALSKVSNIRG